MRMVLSLRHWQIFLILIAYVVAIMGLSTLIHLRPSGIIGAFVLVWIPMMSYAFFIGLALNRFTRMPNRKTNWEFKNFITFGCISALIFLINQALKESHDMDDPGLIRKLIGILMTAFYLFAIFKLVQFPSQTIKSIELKREAGLWEYIADSFQMLFWFIGIWWLQPRINKINQRNLSGYRS